MMYFKSRKDGVVWISSLHADRSQEGRALKMNCPNDHGEMEKAGTWKPSHSGHRTPRFDRPLCLLKCGIKVDDRTCIREPKSVSDAYRKAASC